MSWSKAASAPAECGLVSRMAKQKIASTARFIADASKKSAGALERDQTSIAEFRRTGRPQLQSIILAPGLRVQGLAHELVATASEGTVTAVAIKPCAIAKRPRNSTSGTPPS